MGTHANKGVESLLHGTILCNALVAYAPSVVGSVLRAMHSSLTRQVLCGLYDMSACLCLIVSYDMSACLCLIVSFVINNQLTPLLFSKQC